MINILLLEASLMFGLFGRQPTSLARPTRTLGYCHRRLWSRRRLNRYHPDSSQLYSASKLHP